MYLIMINELINDLILAQRATLTVLPNSVVTPVQTSIYNNALECIPKDGLTDSHYYFRVN